MPQSSTPLGWAGQAHLWGQGPWGRAQGLLLECHGLQGHLPGLGRGGGGGDWQAQTQGTPRTHPALTRRTACLWMKACCRASVEASRPGTGGEPSQRAWIPRDGR